MNALSKNVILVGWRNAGADFWTGSRWSSDVDLAERYDAVDAAQAVRRFREDVDAVQRWGEDDERTLEVK